MFNISFERASIKISDKVWNMTINLVKKVIENTGMDEGEWSLKLPHRIRKKGNERFKAIRQDHNGKVRGIRIRCKPAGNDTSFEYTLIPPSDVDIDVLFNLLLRVNPKNLDIYDTLAMKAAINYPELRRFPRPLPLISLKKDFTKTIVRSASVENSEKTADHQPDQKKLLDICNEFATPIESLKALKEQANGKQANGKEESCFDEASACEGACAEGKESSFVPVLAKNIDRDSDIEKILTLAITEPLLLSDQEVMDRALVAVAFVSQYGYAKRTAASNSIIQNLEILNFINKISNGSYISVEGAMRALTMALRKNNYLERVHHSPKTDAVKGYKITHKGEKRILALKKFLSNEILSKMDHNWAKGSDGHHEKSILMENKENYKEITIIENEIEHEKSILMENKAEDSKEIPIIENEIEHYEKLEALISTLKDANNQIIEASGFIDNLNSEKTDLSVELFGMEKAIEEQIKCKEEIDKRINKLKVKKEEIENKVKEKEKEIEEWRVYQAPYITEKDKIKREIELLAGSVGIGVS